MSKNDYNLQIATACNLWHNVAMNLDRIREKLSNFNLKFKKNAGFMASFIIVYDYINFLKTEPYLKDFLSPLFSYTKEQMDLLNDIAQDPEKDRALNKIELDVLKPETISTLPVFKKEFTAFQSAIEKEEDVNLRGLLSFYLLSLKVVTLKVQIIKDCQQSGDTERADKLIEEIKNESFEIMPPHKIKNVPELKPILSSQYLSMCIEQINKHIIDHIDSQSMFSNEKPESELSFDSKKSILYIKDYKIKVARKSDRGVDHYILECLFKNEYLEDEVYFKDVAGLMGEDYSVDNESWRTYYRACKDLNDKIQKDTDNKIIEFLKPHGGKVAHCKINTSYLEF